MTKREFVERWVLERMGPRDDVAGAIMAAICAWELIGEQIAPDPDVKRNGYIDKLFGGER